VGQPAPAVAHFTRAFADEPSLAGQHGNQFVAAVAAVKAAAQADGEESARLLRQAQDWLRGELADLAKIAVRGTPADQASVRRELHRWQHHVALAGVRDESALAKLSSAERSEWQKFWAEIKTLAR
jgi:hypothetical protein